jgi:hypothetical protein
MLEQAKTVHALDRAATVIGGLFSYPMNFNSLLVITCNPKLVLKMENES